MRMDYKKIRKRAYGRLNEIYIEKLNKMNDEEELLNKIIQATFIRTEEIRESALETLFEQYKHERNLNK